MPAGSAMARRASAMNELLEKTALVDYDHPSIRDLVAGRGWVALNEEAKIRSVYDFVRDEMRFGYNEDDAIPASRVLADGYGQCNTKGILLMALLRAVGVRCRFHGFTIDKRLQKGALSGLWYLLAPREIVHSWIELPFAGRWLNLEGFILDSAYLGSIQAMFPRNDGSFCGYGVATCDLRNPSVVWKGGDTYIQKEGIVRDLGVFPSPDSLFAKHAQALGPLKRLVYRRITRRAMNAKVEAIRRRSANKPEGEVRPAP